MAREALVSLQAPFAPHIAEELWYRMGKSEGVHRVPWSCHDSALASEEVVTVMVQINGKVRGRFEVPADGGGAGPAGEIFW